MMATMPPKKVIDTSQYSGRIAQRMRELREDEGWTVKDLAERVNQLLPEGRRIANSTLHGWENGSRKIDPDYLPAIAKALGLTVAAFLPKK